MKKSLLLLMAVALVAMSSSASTKIYVCGKKITGSTSFTAGGGTVTFDASSYTLTISNVYYLVSGDNNNGISVDNLDQTLKINFEGYNTFGTGDTDAALFKSSGKTIWLTINGNTTFYSADSGHAGLKIQDCYVQVLGPGNLTIRNTSSSNSANAVKGGSGNEEFYLRVKECEIESRGSRIYNLKKLWMEPTSYHGTGDYSGMTTKVTLKAGVNSNVPVKNVSDIIFDSDIHIWLPIDFIDYDPKDYIGSAGLSQTDVVLSDYTPAVIITPYRFPDTNLYNYLKSLVPKKYLTASERDTYTSLNISGKNISSIEGLGQFTKLKVLNFSNNNVTSVPAPYGIPSTVETLYCYNNNLTGLYLGNCQNLFYLDCSNNQITRGAFLPFLISSVLETLYCSNNKLDGECNFTNRKKLRKLDFSNNPDATKLICNGLQLTELNVSGCTSLNEINCSNNQLTSLNNIPNSVQTLNCSNNKFSGTFTLTGRSNLKTLDINSNPNITTLNCYSNALTSLNVQNCSALNTLQCYSNQIPSLNLTGCSALTYLSCQNNQITSFVSLPTTLQTIYCNDNKLSGGTFDVSGRSALKILDIKNNPNFSGLKCNNCSLTSLSVSGCTGLTTLDCSSNLLTSLDVSSLSNLTEFLCNDNKISSLNVANKTKLVKLYAYRNLLTSINVQGCTALKNFQCSSNKLSSLSVQGCSSLTLLKCFGNQIKESAMTSLINSLRTIPAGSTGDFDVIYPGYSYLSYSEGNVITNAQVRAARNKRWIPMKWNGATWVEIPTNIPGDVNGDGTVSSQDITLLYNVLLTGNYTGVVNGDVNGDGTISSADITEIYSILLGVN